MQPAMHQQVTSPPAAKTTDAVAPALAVAAPRRRKSRRRRYIVIGIGALILLGIVGAVIANKREKPIPVTTEKAAKRTILQLVSATGKVQPETEVKISPEVAGEIIELPVIDGAQVMKGDLLVKVRPDSYKALLEQQEAAISSAKATNLQQKATMMKTEQDLKRADDMYSKKRFRYRSTTPRRPLTTWRKILSKARSMRSSEHRPVRVRRGINFPKPRSIRQSMAR